MMESDDIDIISVGKLFTGPWEKKYWSSSRGKFRYPYPVGYKSVRNQSGVSYTMEILQGLRGPSFMISSSDGKSCYGDTPDIAWQSFQNKGFSKLWGGNRFSSKIDGAEVFGLKNTFIQRLLRELVKTSADGTAEQSFLPSNFSNECKPSSPDPDLLTSHVKGKRKSNDKVVTSKRLSKTRVNQHQQEKCTNNGSSSNSKQRDQPNSGISTSADADEVSSLCHSPGVLHDPQNKKCLPIAERANLDITNHREKELTSSIYHLKLNIDNLLQDQEPSDRSRYVKVQGFNNLTHEETGGVGNFQNDLHLPVVDGDDDLYAPDSLDQAEAGDSDSSTVSSLRKVQVNLTVKDAIVNGVGESEVLVSNEIGLSAVCNTSSEKSDTDLVGQELANSIMTVLLPRAVPLLRTSTRKKKKRAKPSNNPTRGSQVENNMPNITSMTNATIASGLAEHWDSERRNEKACHDSVVSTCGNLDYDSFYDDVPQDLLPHGQFSCNLDPPPSQLPINVKAEANPFLCHRAIREHDTEITANSKQAEIGPAIHDASQMEGASRSESTIPNNDFPHICMSEKTEARFAFANFKEDAYLADCDNSSSKNIKIPSTSTSCCNSMTKNNEMSDESMSDIHSNNNLGGLFKLYGCYVHPMPISMVQLIVKENGIFIFVKCGYTLFLYKALENGENIGGCPSLIGHVPISFQITKDVGRNIAADRSLLQLTPDAQSIVMLNSIKTPCCREGILHCPCPDCTSDICERNAVKIVRLKLGYASVVTKLKTAQAVRCLLVCEPSFLLAAEEDGKLKLWVMNTAWSGQKEDWHLPTFDWIFPTIVELKTITKSAVLVVGHNGFGEFGLWDIEKRNLVSRFSSPGLSVLECVPACVFRWQRKGHCMTEPSILNEILDATKTRFSEKSRFSPEDNSDVAVWLLISTPPDPDEQETSGVGGCWRLALLVNNLVITGTVVDGGAAAAVTSVGHGVVGSNDGLVYLWELSTGEKLANLHSFRGSRVSYVTTDTSESGALAIASADQLLVYLPS